MNNKELGYALLDHITDEMDIVFGATVYPWRMRVSQYHYDVLKEWDTKYKPVWHNRLFFYTKDGVEYIRPIENYNVPFILDYRVVIDETITGLPIVELDDAIEPDILARRNKDWEEYCEIDHI